MSAVGEGRPFIVMTRMTGLGTYRRARRDRDSSSPEADIFLNVERFLWNHADRPEVCMQRLIVLAPYMPGSHACTRDSAGG